MLSHARNRRHQGIGIETVRALASAGARVLLTSPSVQAAQQVAQQLRADGVTVRIAVHAASHAGLSTNLFGGPGVHALAVARTLTQG